MVKRDRAIEHLHPNMQDYNAALQAELEAAGLADFAVYETARGPRLQERGVRRGTSRARYGRGRHGYGLAVDRVHCDPALAAAGRWPWSWDITAHPYARFGAIARKVGLEWGGDWPSFAEGAHVQAPGWTVERLQRAEHVVDAAAGVGSARWRAWLHFWWAQTDEAYDLVVHGVRIGERLHTAALQQLLHLTGVADPGPVDGVPGALTAAAAARLVDGPLTDRLVRARLRATVLECV